MLSVLLLFAVRFFIHYSLHPFLSVRNLPSASPSRLHSGGLVKLALSLAKENAATRRFSSLPTLYLYSFKENLRFYSNLLPLSFYIDPSLTKTVFTVIHKILISSAGLHSFIYFVSSLTTSSKSVMSLRPLTCHIPVMPGLIASLAR